MRPGQLEEMVPVGGRATTSRWMSTATALFVAMLSTEHMDPFMQMAVLLVPAVLLVLLVSTSATSATTTSATSTIEYYSYCQYF